MQALTGAGVAIDHSLIYAEGGFLELDDQWQIPAPLVERLADFLRHRTDVTAIFATNAHLALLAMQAIARVGLRVPEDLSLVSVDTFEVIPLGPPLLTCALQRGTGIGAAAVDLLEEGLAGAPPRRVLLPMDIRTGRSIAPPAGRDQARADSPER